MSLACKEDSDGMMGPASKFASGATEGLDEIKESVRFPYAGTAGHGWDRGHDFRRLRLVFGRATAAPDQDAHHHSGDAGGSLGDYRRERAIRGERHVQRREHRRFD